MTTEEAERRFGYHKPANDAVVSSHEMVRASCRHLAEIVDKHVPDGREKSLATTKIEEAMMWANAGIARGRSFGGGA